MRWYVDAWEPAYGTSFDGWAGPDGGPGARSSAEVDTDVERPADAWEPLSAPPDARAPDVVLLVDGVRRNDASLWTAEDDGTSYPGLAASYAAGVVRCDLRRGAAELVAARVDRGLFTASPTAAGEVLAGRVCYPVRQVRGAGDPHSRAAADPQALAAAVQPHLTALEVAISAEARSGTDDLLVVDGPLRSRQQLPRTVGYVKTQQSQYLPAALVPVVTALRPGQRSPVFRIGTRWHSYSWYLRLPGRGSPSSGLPSHLPRPQAVATREDGGIEDPRPRERSERQDYRPGAPWAGMVRVECSVEWPASEAVALADLSAVTLPRFASSPYKDPRAPQNLIPIAGLERRLRGMLGDPRLLHRALTVSAASPVTGTTAAVF